MLVLAIKRILKGLGKESEEEKREGMLRSVGNKEEY